MKANKNIHILPTPNPSRLHFNQDINKLTLNHKLPEGTNSWKPQNIYITSDEEIKEGDCVYHTQMFNHIGFTGIARVGKQRVNQEFEITSLDGQHTYYSCKEPKVVLTTDQDLIKDGVQAIDDDFLEWFVKNPSCEEVGVENERIILDDVRYNFDVVEYKYKIIIPKQEPKKVLTEEDIFNQKDIDAVTDYINRETSKQETLEEVAERLKGKELFKESNDRARKILSEIKSLPIQERMYSEEDLKEAFDSAREFNSLDGIVDIHIVLPMGGDMSDLQPLHFTFEEWFEKFKKK